jgi:hypothetical protein
MEIANNSGGAGLLAELNLQCALYWKKLIRLCFAW